MAEYVFVALNPKARKRVGAAAAVVGLRALEVGTG